MLPMLVDAEGEVGQMTHSVHDVAAYILEQAGSMTAMKLQKLCYYAHAWHLVWEEEPLFSERIEAWANGPVCRDLYDLHRGQFTVSKWSKGDSSRLGTKETSSIDPIIKYYGKKSAHELSELTHREDPWKNARKNLPAGSRSNAIITDAAMHEYYDGLTSASS